MRLIDADALTKEWKKLAPVSYSLCGMVLDAAPTVDAVSIVRCSECKYGIDCWWMPGYIECENNSQLIAHSSEFYCANGVKIEDKENDNATN